MIVLKTKEEIEIMRHAGRVAAMTLNMVADNIEAGMTWLAPLLARSTIADRASS